jgi:alpha-glucosidase
MALIARSPPDTAVTPAGGEKMSYEYVNVRRFMPNKPAGMWQSVSPLSGFEQAGNSITLIASAGAGGVAPPAPVITFCSPTCFRVRFNPSGVFPPDASYAVVNGKLGAVAVVATRVGNTIELVTSAIKVIVDMNPYRVRVYRGAQLIHADAQDYNLVYIPGQEVIANFKVYPKGARYFGFGEKAGAQLAKNELSMTFFNFDNFTYTDGVPPGNTVGPLDPSSPLYCSVPFLLEVNPNPENGAAYHYGLFFDNAAQSYFNIGANDYGTDMSGRYYFGALYGDLNYYFFYGADIPSILTQYAGLTGFPPMPPRYVFGYHQGAYGYYSGALLEGVAKAYRQHEIPIDGLHIDVDFQDNYRTFTSSNLKFPNPKGIFDDLHNIGFKLSTNITPLISKTAQDETGNVMPYLALDSGLAVATGATSGAFITDPRAANPDPHKAFVGSVNYGQNPGSNPFQSYPVGYGPPILGAQLGADGYYADFGQASVRTWWGTRYTYLLGLGLDMIWQDMTCPALFGPPAKTFPLDTKMTDAAGNLVENARMHNGYVLTLLNATYDGVNKIRADKRNFIIARGGYAGMQRYAALWTGDSASSWDFLRINIPEVLNLGLSGIPISGCDIGGFAPDPNQPDGLKARLSGGIGSAMVGGYTDPELLTRWMQLGSFLPWYRNHYNGYSKEFQEPYRYGQPVLDNCRKYIELRYRMLHIYYSAMYEATQTGAPIARAMFYNAPDGKDLTVYEHLNDQFFVARDFLVAPIVAPGPPYRDVYLPSGSDWYAFMDNRAPLAAMVGGGTLVTRYFAPPDLVPVYVRAGAILPFCELEQYVGQLNLQGKPNPITFNAYPGPDRWFDLYQDDGITRQSPQPQRLTRISQTTAGGSRRIRVQRISGTYAPQETFYFVAFLGVPQAPGSIAAADAVLPDVGTPEALAASAANAYYWNRSIEIAFVKIFDTSADITVTQA